MKKKSKIITNELLIKRLNKTQRKLFFSMKHIKWMIMFLISAALCFIISLFVKSYNEWFSALLQSIGCSIVAGWVMYIISNKRMQSEQYLDNAVDSLTELNHCAHNVYFAYPLSSELYMIPYYRRKQNWSDKVYETLENADDFIRELYKLKYSIYRKMRDDIKMDIDVMKEELHNIRKNIPMKLDYAAGKEIQEQIIKVIKPCANYIHEELQNVSIQRSQLEKYPI